MSRYTYAKRNLPDWDAQIAADLKISIKAYCLREVLRKHDRPSIMAHIAAEIDEFAAEFNAEDEVERSIAERYRAELTAYAAEAYDRAVSMVGGMTPYMFAQALTARSAVVVKPQTDEHGRTTGATISVTKAAARATVESLPEYTEGGFNRGIEAGKFYGDVQKDIKAEMRDYVEFKQAAKLPYLTNVNQRNIVEMGVRFRAYQELKQRLISEGVRLVYVPPHANCSKRCQPFQGRCYSLTGQTEHHDGRTFPPIEEVAENRTVRGKRDPSRVYAAGLFAYNCRHTMEPYEDGQQIETIPKGVIDRQREIETRQRELEREIRALREKHMLYKIVYDESRKPEIKEEAAKTWRLYLQRRAEYYDFCSRNNVPQFGDRLKVVAGEDIYQRTVGRKDARVKNIKISRP